MAKKASAGVLGRHSNIYLYIPNLIGYARVLLALGAFTVALRDPNLCFILYALSFVCDELDGRFARMFNQQSTFGAVLDMVTDRVATSCLLATLCVLYPEYHTMFLALLMLDIFSHWFQMYATLASGSATHKDTKSHSFLVRIYYQHRIFMGFCCVCVEVLYLIVYLMAFEQWHGYHMVDIPSFLDVGHMTGKPTGQAPLLCVIAGLCMPGFAIKQIVNFAQLKNAANQLIAVDLKPSRARKSR